MRTTRPILSATQIDTFEHCKRQWAWERIAKIPREQTKYAAKGEALHLIAENYLRDGKAPPTNGIGKIFMAGIKHLPAPGVGIVEGPFLWEPKGVLFALSGKIDLVHTEDKLLIVTDHKSTSDFKWMKKKDELQNGIQPVIYLSYVTSIMECEEIGAKWVYYLTNEKRPASRAIFFVLTAKELKKKFQRICLIGDEMVSLLEKKPDVTTLPFNLEWCDAYGGCPYRDKCVFTPEQRMRSIMTQLSLKEKLEIRAKQTASINSPEGELARQVAPPVPVAEPVAVATAQPVQMPVEALKAEMTAQVAERPMTLKERMAAKMATMPTKILESSPAQQVPEKTFVAPPQVKIEAAKPVEVPKMPEPTILTKKQEAAKVTAPAPIAEKAEGVTIKGFVLFVDCVPLKMNGGLQFFPLSNLLGKDDLGKYLDENPIPANYAVSLSLRTPEGQGAYYALEARAALVVRGM